MKYRALRTVRGDYGLIHPGGTFDTHPTRGMDQLEAKGIVERVIERPKRKFKAIQMYENKAVTLTENK